MINIQVPKSGRTFSILAALLMILFAGTVVIFTLLDLIFPLIASSQAIDIKSIFLSMIRMTGDGLSILAALVAALLLLLNKGTKLTLIPLALMTYTASTFLSWPIKLLANQFGADTVATVHQILPALQTVCTIGLTIVVAVLVVVVGMKKQKLAVLLGSGLLLLVYAPALLLGLISLIISLFEISFVFNTVFPYDAGLGWVYLNSNYISPLLHILAIVFACLALFFINLVVFTQEKFRILSGDLSDL